MFDLRNDRLIARCPNHHVEAQLTIEFQRTLRIPDDGRDYPCQQDWGGSRCATSMTSPSVSRPNGWSTAA